MTDENNLLPNPDAIAGRLLDFQSRLRERLSSALLAQSEALCEVAVNHASDGDTIYRIDVQSEELLFEFCEEWGAEAPFTLVAEGVPGNGHRTFPANANPASARFFLIVDPIDGTREIMYDKRSAWSLAGVAPNLGTDTTMADIEIAVMTELPTTRSLYTDAFWAVRGAGAKGIRRNLVTGAVVPVTPRPSQSPTVAHGFASITKFFPGTKVPAAQMEENLFYSLFGDLGDTNPLAFDDQYISTGGQLYELLVGHDRFIADLRPLFIEGKPLLCCHPYDLCTELIAREAGIIITNEYGEPVRAPLDIREPVAWVGYANPAIHDEIRPTLKRLLTPYLP
ncbi:MAG: inositol monophosphatase [Armatimonadetes bacterium]|nr:inositol monophosphatase [Armatimonadota bacterium]